MGMPIRVSESKFNLYRDEIAARLTVLPTTLKMIREFERTEVRAQDLAEMIGENPYLSRLLIETLRRLGLEDETPSLTTVVSLLGMFPVRNLVCATQMRISVSGERTELVSEHSFRPSETLTYALRAEAYFEEHRILSPEGGFSAGLVFDFLCLMGRDQLKVSGEILKFLDTLFERGLQAVGIAQVVGRANSSFQDQANLNLASLCHGIGRFVFALLDEHYFKWYTLTAAQGFDRQSLILLERSRFGVSHETFAAMVAGDFEFLARIEKMLLFSHESYLTRDRDPKLFSSALVLNATLEILEAKSLGKKEISLASVPEYEGTALENEKFTKIFGSLLA